MKVKHYLINYLTNHLLKAVSEEDILQITEDGYLHKRRKLTPQEVATLKEEAKMMQDSFLWKLMTKEVEYMAFLRMTAHAKTNDDIVFGKAVYYSTDLLKKFLEGLSNR